MSTFDLVVRGGTVVDGTGAEPFEADVAVKAGKIVEVGKVAGSGSEEIAAKGKIVTPGFVDIHTHYDAQATFSERFWPSTGHGVTTVVMGNCAVGFAPCRPEQRDTLIKVMEGVEDIPDIVMKRGIPWSWTTFPEYLDALSQRAYDADVAAQVPHAPVRVFVMGKRGVDREPATLKDMAQMAKLVQEGIEAGALGFSTSRLLIHRLKDGSLAPTITAGWDEIRTIALAMKAIGKGVLQTADSFLDVEQEFAQWRRIIGESGVKMSFSFTQSSSAQADQWKRVLPLLDAANRDGVTIKGQVCNRPIGVMFGLEASYHAFSLCPSYAAIADLPRERKVAELRRPELRARLLAETPQDPNEFLVLRTRAFDHMWVLGDPPNYLPSPDDTIALQAQRRGVPVLDFVYDLLLQEEGRTLLFLPVSNYHDNNTIALHTMMTHPHTVQGIADGGAHLGMICDASAPTHLLAYWTRDCSDNEKLPLPWAVQSLSQETAATVGLNDRGVVAPGYKGDLNVIDYDRLKLGAPVPVRDLPAGGRRFMQKADGYVATVLNGTVTYRDGEPTTALPGRLVRGTKDAPQGRRPDA